MNEINFQYKGRRVTKRADGYTNITEVCRNNKQKVGDWLDRNDTRSYIIAVSEHLKRPVEELLEYGNADELWAHPLIAIRVNQWVSDRFLIWCNSHVIRLINEGNTLLVGLHDILNQSPDTAKIAQEEPMIDLQLRVANLEGGNEPESSPTISGEELMVEGLRIQVNSRLRDAVTASPDLTYRDAWNAVYKEIYYRYSIDIKWRAVKATKARKKKVAPLDIAEELGLLRTMLEIIEQMYGETTPAQTNRRLYTDQERILLLERGSIEEYRDDQAIPLLKLHIPNTAVWLISSATEVQGINGKYLLFFGIADLGLGIVEWGYIDEQELLDLYLTQPSTIPGKVKRDWGVVFKKPMGYYHEQGLAHETLIGLI